MNTTLQKTANYFRCVGILNEIKLTRKETMITLRKDGQETGKTKGECIYGSFTVKTDNGIHEFNFYGQSLNQEGAEAKNWKMYTEMENWNPMIGGNSSIEPTLVDVGGSVEINDYPNERTGEISSSLRWRISKASSKVNPEAPKGTALNATLFIRDIKNEIKNEEETGRLIVTLYGANNKGECFPVTAIVDSESADDFESYYEKYQTVAFNFELVSRQVGTVKTGTKKFGRATSVTVSDGYTINELILVGGDEPIEEPDELTTINENGEEVEVKTKWINPATMSMAIKAREQMLEELKNNPPKKKSTPVKSKEDMIRENLNNAKFGKKSDVNIDDEFDDDDDLF